MRSALFISFILATKLCLAQSVSSAEGKKDEVFTIVEEMPEYPGGIAALYKYLSGKMTYPKKAVEMNIGGKAFLKFIVEETGMVSNVQVVRSSGLAELDAEAERVVQTMEKWSPGKQQGKPVKVYYNLPISFVLNAPYHIFNAADQNEAYVRGWNNYLSGDMAGAVKAYQEAVGDVYAWYNLGVLYFQTDKKLSRQYFENVVANLKDEKSQYYVMSTRFLNSNF
jgi:protein TonB